MQAERSRKRFPSDRAGIERLLEDEEAARNVGVVDRRVVKAGLGGEFEDVEGWRGDTELGERVVHARSRVYDAESFECWSGGERGEVVGEVCRVDADVVEGQLDERGEDGLRIGESG